MMIGAFEVQEAVESLYADDGTPTISDQEGSPGKKWFDLMGVLCAVIPIYRFRYAWDPEGTLDRVGCMTQDIRRCKQLRGYVVDRGVDGFPYERLRYGGMTAQIFCDFPELRPYILAALGLS